jgi:Holliday junction resolvasome RuvABC endonuclease subunit
MKTLIGIDPGERASGIVVWQDGIIVEVDQARPNAELAESLAAMQRDYPAAEVVIERPAPMGQPLSGNLVETTVWCGVFWARCNDAGLPIHWLTRNQIKVAICGGCKGVKDAHVSTGVQERFGGRKAALGSKSQPGPCYGVSGHAWQALAAVVAWLEIQADTGGD